MRFLILGPLEVRDERGVVALGGIKPRAVLAMLLVHANQSVSTERLALAVWGEDAPAGAAKNVHVHVSRLRKALGDRGVIETTPAGYRLLVQPDELDVARFERLLEDGRRALAEGQPVRARTVLREALGLWRGPALAELACEPFAGAEIARLEEQRLAALEARVEADLAAGRHSELVGELRQLVAVHPTRERLAAHLMLALYRCGRQTEALEVYQDARRRLVGEVGIEPGPQLRELQEAILRHDVVLDPRGGVPELDAATVSPNASAARDAAEPVMLALPRTLHTAGSGPFVGRDSELEALRERWVKAQGDVGSMVVITGEPGIGKTRLASELAREVHGEGGLVLYGRCDDGFAVPCQPFVEALRPYVHAVGVDRLRSELGALAPQLGRLLPELARLGGAARSDPESERFAVFEAIAALFEVMTRERRALLIVDDLHWAACHTLLLLRHLIRCDRPLRLLIVGSYRETDLNARHRLGQLLADLQRDSDVEHLSIGGLAEPAIAMLLEAMVGRALHQQGADVVQLLQAQTAGNPLFIRELLAHLCESGAIVRDGAHPSLDAAAAQLNVPKGLRQVIGQRITRLSEPAQRALRVAAVAGSTFSFVLLERVLGEQSGVLEALDEAVAAGLLTEAGLIDYAFAHALVRQTIYEDLSAARRMRMHRQLGEALETFDDTDTHLEALAHHFGHAAADGQADKAADYALAAGVKATTRSAFEDAVAHFERGLQALTLATPPRERLRGKRLVAYEQRRSELLVGLATAFWGAGELDKARQVFKEAASRATPIQAAIHARRRTLTSGVPDMAGAVGLAVPDRPQVPGLGDVTVLVHAALRFCGPHVELASTITPPGINAPSAEDGATGRRSQ